MFKQATIAGKRPFLKWTNCYEEIQIKKVPMRECFRIHLTDILIPQQDFIRFTSCLYDKTDLIKFLSCLKKKKEVNLYVQIDTEYKVLALIFVNKKCERRALPVPEAIYYSLCTIVRRNISDDDVTGKP